MSDRDRKHNKTQLFWFFIVPAACVFLILFSLIFKMEVAGAQAQDLSNKARYDNYRLYRLHIKTEDHVKILQELEEKSDSYTFYGHARKPDQDLTVLVAANKIAEVHEIMERYEIAGEILHRNVQALIDTEALTIKPKDTAPTDFDWAHYHHLDTINRWLDYVVEKYDFVTGIDLGKSYDGLDVKGIKLAKKESNPTIFIEGGIHAREWISPATTTFIINQLLTSDRSDVKDLADNYNWFFFPCINPDGYKYTFEKDRLWRKNRKPYGLYLGVDLNRNFDSDWNGTGASGDPQRYDFSGAEAFSEPETKNVNDFFKKYAKKEDIRTYIALHSFSQLVMFPYGFTTEKAKNYDDLTAIGNRAVQAIEAKHGKKYVSGASIETIYPSSGDSVDWAYEKGYVNISFIIELRGPPDSTNMFILPAEEITPTGEEILEAFIAMIQEGRARGYYERK